jgi:hypothetical protein
LPNYALLGLFLACTISTIVYLGIFFRLKDKANGKVRKILKLATLSVVLFNFEMMALWLENGWYTATSIMVCLVIGAFCAWASEISAVSLSRQL